MTRLSAHGYLDHIRDESARFRAALNGCRPDARVPSCPEWDAADLLWHVTEVQDFWAWIVRHRPAGPDERTAPPRPASYAELLAAAESATARLATALAEADPTEHAWSWADEQTVAFTLRRQAHEALIHRVDAEQTAGTRSPIDRDLAADGVEEALDVMYGGSPPFGSFTADGQTVRIDLTDAGVAIWVQLGRFTGTSDEGTVLDGDDLRVIHPADATAAEPAAVVCGEAGVLDTWLWRRADDAGITVHGDHAAYERFRRVVDAPIV